MDSTRDHLPMLDKVIEIVPGARITALKNVSINESFFGGHFPEMPVMPGALIVESMAQAAMLMFSEVAGGPGTRWRMSSIKAKFLNPVFPGDQLVINVTASGLKPGSAQATAQASVAGVQAARADITLEIVHD